MTVPIPSKVRVGPFVYTVSQDVKELQAHEREKSGGYAGFSDHSKLRIVVDATDAPDAQRETMWHEVKHAVHHLYANSGEKVDDETHIRKMAPMELAVLRDNPDLVAYLMDGVQRTVMLPPQQWEDDRQAIVKNGSGAPLQSCPGTSVQA